MKRFHYLAAADADLDNITEYFSSHSPAAGAMFFNEFESRCRMTSAFPKTGRPREEYGPGIRSFVVGSYVAFFRPFADGILILRVLHGSRDVTPEMFPDE